MSRTLRIAFWDNFLGHSPLWYKQTIVVFLTLNPLLLYSFGPFVTGWLLIIQFIFTLAMALKCYPLQPGGLLAIEAIILNLTSAHHVYDETVQNFPVILLLIFMVAGIFFMKDLLMFVFTRILLSIRSKILLSLLFCSAAAILSAFLDALTVTAVLISVALGFYEVYHKTASGKHFNHPDHDRSDDGNLEEQHRGDLRQFREFLRSLLMHGAVGTALGGATTLVGEPQNLKIAKEAGWDFIQFFIHMVPVTIPVLLIGLITCIILEKYRWFGYGVEIPASVREILTEYTREEDSKRSTHQNAKLISQALVAVFLTLALAFHIAEVGIIGLTVIVLLTAFCGVTDEAQLGKAFEEALPFTALLVVFFGIVAVINEQQLFSPVIDYVLQMDTASQPGMFFIANGLLSMISDNVFVATVYITQIKDVYTSGLIDQALFTKLVIAINTGTNLPSVATPNGQAAFLFLLTSSIAPLIRLSYGRMVYMALPYTLVMGTTGYICVSYFI